MTFYIRYVPYKEVAAWEAIGWVDCGPVPGHHAIYSQRMRWDGEGEPVEPQFQKAAAE